MTHARQTNTIPFMCSGGATATTYTHTLAHHYERLLFRQLYSMSVANCLIHTERTTVKQAADFQMVGEKRVDEQELK